MTLRQSFGTRAGVTLHLAAWDGVGAAVDLSCACMFAHEAHGHAPVGGLAHLDAALGQRLVGWRRDGAFTAARGEMLLVDRPPTPIAAGAVLVIGLGTPDDWSTEVIAGAVATAFAAAHLRRATSVAFAPSMLDGGLSPDEIGDAATSMVRALVRAIDCAARLAHEGLAAPSSVRDWTFDVGAARFDSALDRFGTALAGA